MEEIERTDYPYEPYGEPEDWTWEGMKVYHYSWKFNKNLDFIEMFCTEDGSDWMNVTEKKDWDDRIWKLAYKYYYI